MTLGRLRRQAVASVVGSVGTSAPSLAEAISRLGFVQADPIRAPARAQDLILRQRVKGYRAGDLERHYPSLELEEDVLYAYGFLSRTVWHWLAPRRRALESLHAHGLLRISRRESGIRVYAPATVRETELDTAQRLGRLGLVLAGIFAPAPEKTLRAMIARLGRAFPDAEPRKVLPALVDSGALHREVIDGVAYLWPTEIRPTDEEPSRVHLLAPFDPVVWDRDRFEHLWGWAYRFEAYTPIKKRVRGYYALPLLWRSDVIGWANVQLVDGELAVDLGFVGKRPRDRQFSSELDAELTRLRTFLDAAPAP